MDTFLNTGLLLGLRQVSQAVYHPTSNRVWRILRHLFGGFFTKVFGRFCFLRLIFSSYLTPEPLFLPGGLTIHRLPGSWSILTSSSILQGVISVRKGVGVLPNFCDPPPAPKLEKFDGGVGPHLRVMN
jgi:hypothetical protein